MIKKISVAAVAGVLASAAWADNVTIYGVVDAGLAYRSGGDGAVPDFRSRTEVASGLGTGGSRIGFRGAEDLGGGTKAIFEIEYGVNIDQASSSNSMITRHSYVGLTGNWGTLLGGRVDGARASLAKRFDVFGGSGVANFGSLLEPVISRADNALVYVSPTWQGLSLTAAYTLNVIGQEGPGNAGDSPVYALIFNYNNGPLSLTYDHEEEWFREGSALPVRPRYKVNVFGATYDFGFMKLIGYAERVTADRATGVGYLDSLKELKAYYLGVSVPVMANGLAKASWARRDRKYSDDKCDKFGLGFQYNLSKRTFLYTDFAHINNKSGGTCTIGLFEESGSADYNTNTDGGGALAGGTPGGYGTRGFDLGIAHRF